MKSANVLVVDDNETLIETMARVLKKKGYSVETANGGMEAIEIVKENDSIDIVFLDIKMPLLNGVETYKRIKEYIPKAVVFMMTGYAVEELIQEAIEEGAHDVVYKPVDFNKLLQLIKEARSTKKSALILIVDDDDTIRETFARVLQKRGYSVKTTGDGEEAIKVAEVNQFDILFIDLKLPTINGLETYLRIKEFKPDIIAVIVTGFSQELGDIVEKALWSSAYACLNKPLDMAQILKLVDDVLTKKNAARSSP